MVGHGRKTPRYGYLYILSPRALWVIAIGGGRTKMKGGAGGKKHAACEAEMALV